MIDKLTEQQEKDLVEFRERYLKIGTNTDVADTSVTQELDEFFDYLNMDHPTYVHVDNPYEANVLLTALSNKDVYLAHQKALEGEIDFGEMISEKLIADLESYMKENNISINSYGFLSGANNAYWVSLYQFGKHIGVEYEEKDDNLLQIWERFIKKVGYVFLVDHVCVYTNRPSEIHFNDQGEGHCEDGPYIKFRRGEKSNVYGINGVVVPKHVVMEPEKIDLKMIDDEQNAEIKRIMIERMGIGKYLEVTKAEVIDGDMTFVSQQNDDRHVPRALMKDREGRKFLVGTDGSTDRVYYMQVPEECETCKEASNALAGVDEDNIIAVS